MTNQGDYDVFVTKLTPAGNELVYSTYIGGSGVDYGLGIAVDAGGAAYITGTTSSANFPTQSAYQTAFHNTFVTKLSSQGNALVYSTYLGGNTGDYARAIAVDGAGSAYVTGATLSADFPTQSPYQATLRGVQDAFVTKLAPSGNALTYSTYLGGTGEDEGLGVAVDAAGSTYITGSTESGNFPTQAAYQTTAQGAREAFVTKLAPLGNALVFSTYLGGSESDFGRGVAVGKDGSVYVAGETWSTNFPTLSSKSGRRRRRIYRQVCAGRGFVGLVDVSGGQQ